MKKIIFFSALLLAFSMATSSCKKDPCKDSYCLNGGACIDGDCKCPEGFSGEHCQTEVSGPGNTILPIADISASTYSINAGETVTFTDNSINADSREWIFSGGNPSASSQKTVTVKYENAGTFTVTLKANNQDGSDKADKSITVVKRRLKASFSLNSGPVKDQLLSSSNDLEFVRYDYANNIFNAIMKYENAYYYYNVSNNLKSAIDGHWQSLNPATWIGKDNKWIIVYSNNGYSYSGLPANVGDIIKQFHDYGDTFKRIDRDSYGNFVILTNNHWWTWSNTGINNIIENNNISSFAFGKEGSWVAINKNQYWYSGNAPSGLVDKIGSVLNSGYELVDVEIGDDSWVLIYR